MTNNPQICPMLEDAAALACGGLDKVRAGEVMAHIETCGTCRAEHDSAAQLVSVLKDGMPAEVPCDVYDRVMSAVECEPAQESAAVRKNRLVLFPILLRAAAVLAVMFAVVFTLKRVDALKGKDRSPAAAALSKDEAVRDALAWLIRNQEADGSWNAEKWGGKTEYQVSLAAMAVMALHKASTSGRNGAYEINRDRGVAFIIGSQEPDGRLGPKCEGSMYNHGIATVALLDVYRRTGEDKIKRALDSAVDFTKRQQLVSGGWGYSAGDERDANTSISVWQLHGLLLAEQSGWSNIKANLNRGFAWLAGMVSDKGGFGYRQAGDSANSNQVLTAMGAYCVFKAKSRSPELRALLPSVSAALAMAVPADREVNDFYRFYFLVAAMDLGGTEKYGNIAGSLRDAIISKRVVSGANGGTWDPDDRWSSIGGRLYTTIMATLSLETGA